jgi:exopolyphosphatase/guanosine-5'-triphosphate,3'-diphosphate pyrophosphatase
MRIASVDIGTNAVLLLVVEKESGLQELHDTSTITRLGEGLLASGLLSDSGMTRTLNALKRYMTILEGLHAEKVLCYGTAALREARNRDAFIRRVREEIGFEVQVLSEHDEAYYTYLSIRGNGLIEAERFIIIDIGGGSTELIEGSNDAFAGSLSIPIGTVKLTEQCIHHDPPTSEQIGALVGVIEDHLSSVKVEKEEPLLVGVGGTMTTLAAIVLGLATFDKTRIEGLVVTGSALDGWIDRTASMTTDERRMIPGMEPGREDLLLQGIILMREIMRHYRSDRVIISTYGGRYGVIYECVKRWEMEDGRME